MLPLFKTKRARIDIDTFLMFPYLKRKKLQIYGGDNGIDKGMDFAHKMNVTNCADLSSLVHTNIWWEI